MAKAATKGKAAPEAKKPATKNLPAKVDVKSTLPADAEAMFFDPSMGTGLENVTAKDLLIPRLTILQGLSPQVSQGKPEYDDEAKVGDIYDIGLQQRFTEGLHFLPVHFIKQWLEWFPRRTQKGLAAIHETPAILEKCTLDERNKPTLPNGNYVAETMQFYGLNLSAGFRRSFLPFASTQLKKGRRLLTLATSEKILLRDGREMTPPLFYRTYRLGVVPESNAEGNWMGWTIERDIQLDELPNWQNLMQDIKEFRESLTSGDIRGDIAAMADEVRHEMEHANNGAM